LIEDLKFDLRIYVLVYGCDPLRIYIHNEGLARLATEEYEAPSKGNMKNLYMHLTNYAINKDSENFVFNTDSQRADIGHKRSLSFVWSYIDSHGGNSKLLKRKIKKSIVKTLCAVQPHLAHSYKMCQPNNLEDNMCFEILGFDILIDHKLKPWLLEVNHSPSFTTDTPFDYKVKYQIIEDTLRILHMNSNNRVKYYQQKQDEMNARVLGRGQGKLAKEEKKDLHRKAIEERDKYEQKHLGGYIRAYPDPKLDDKYKEYISVATRSWDEFYGYNKRTTVKEKVRNTDTKTTDKVLMKTVKKNTVLPNVKPSQRKFTPDKYNRTKASKLYSRESRDKSSSVLRPEDWTEGGVNKTENEFPKGRVIRDRLLSEISQVKFKPIENSDKGLEIFGKRVIGSLPKPHGKIIMHITNNEMKGCFK
jgi:tubulin polyglutamylase TTLL6/13